MLVSHYRAGERTIVVVEAERLDSAVAADFKQEVVALFEDGATDIVVDMGKVLFIDSSALGALVALHKLVSQDGRFAVAGLGRTVAKVFQLTRMTMVFTILDRAPAEP